MVALPAKKGKMDNQLLSVVVRKDAMGSDIKVILEILKKIPWNLGLIPFNCPLFLTFFEIFLCNMTTLLFGLQLLFFSIYIFYSFVLCSFC